MKRPINEIKKMQLIAGLITESEYQESLTNEEMSAPQVLDMIKKVDQKLESLKAEFLQMKEKLKSGDTSVTADAVLDLGLKVFSEIEAIAN